MQIKSLKTNLSFIIIFTILAMNPTKSYAQDQTVGVFINDTTNNFNGYTLLIPREYTSTYLIDNAGRLINEWTSDYVPSMSAYLLENGNLLRSAKVESGIDPEDPVGGFQVLDWESNVVWEYYAGRQHHDIEPMPNGNVLLVLTDPVAKPVALAAGRDPDRLAGNNVRSLRIIEVEYASPDSGTIVWDWYLWDHLIQEFDASKENFGNVSDHPELIDINYGFTTPNWAHVNSIGYNEELDQIIVSSRGFNEIWIIDHSTSIAEAASTIGGNNGMGGDILYRWGNPEAYQAGIDTDQKLFGQHDAQWIDKDLMGEDNILIFNNGATRPDGAYSSIDEFTTPVDESGNYDLEAGNAFVPEDIIWRHPMELTTADSFYSATWSGAQRLPNGNTIICSGQQSMLFEVTNSGTIAWKYINPVSESGPIIQGIVSETTTLGRVQKYSTDYPGLLDKDLTPGLPIELYPVQLADEQSIPQNYYLYNNYPNPFNATTTIKFEILQSSKVTLTIYNLLGLKIATLVNDNKNPGSYSVSWHGLNDEGVSVVSGVYFYQLLVGNNISTNKMILLK